ncbi:MAG TPA: hypothetical protein VN843_31935 [Anaerolineales bacterium]|nr:hypothetical protein [Anaerolineales bacterium]
MDLKVLPRPTRHETQVVTLVHTWDPAGNETVPTLIVEYRDSEGMTEYAEWICVFDSLARIRKH